MPCLKEPPNMSAAFNYAGLMTSLKEYTFVTGGAGYIGSNLISVFSTNTNNLVIIDRPEMKFHLPVGVGLELGDLTDSDFMEKLKKKYSDAEPQSLVVHLAAEKSVEESISNPSKYLQGNLSSTRNIIDFALHLNIKRFIFASTAAVYGNSSQEGPIAEDSEVHPMSPYAESKILCERIVQEATQFDLRIAILRFFNIVGAVSPSLIENDGTNLLPRIIRNYNSGEVNTIFGNTYPTVDGTCERDYLDIRDLISGVISSANYLRSRSLGVLNLGSGRNSSVLEIFQLLQKKVPNLYFEIGEKRSGDPASIVADISTARDILGWQPAYDISDSINSVLSKFETK